jgi:hypothetical protein
MGGGIFRTTMSYDAKLDRWSWTMDMDQGGKLALFARTILTRR